MSGTIHVSRPVEGVLRLEIDCPPANALGSSALQQMLDALDAAEADLSLRAVIIGARGKGFCAGADLREATDDPQGGSTMFALFARVIAQVEGLRIPVIAAVHGHCTGGGLELALACDLRVAVPDASFCATAVNVGLIASIGRLPRLVGPGWAREMLLTGSPMDAATALRCGLVTRLSGKGDHASEADMLAARIASRAPLSVEAVKRTLSSTADLGLAEANAAMLAEFSVLRETRDHKDAVASFLAGGSPRFTRH